MKLALLLLIIYWSPNVIFGCGSSSGSGSGCNQMCPYGWSKFGSRCYKYFANKKTADEAETHCASNSAHLTSINSYSEHCYVYDLWQASLVSHTPDNINVNTMNSLWIGGKRKQVGNSWTWTWTDDSRWSYTNWATYGNQPSGDGNCAHMWTYGQVQPSGGWNDVACDSSIYKTYYVCERPTANSCGGGGGGSGGGHGAGGNHQFDHHL